MKTIKEAADSLLLRNEITKDEYDYLEKSGAFKIPDPADMSTIVDKISNPTLKKVVGNPALKTTGDVLTVAGEGIKKLWPLAGLFGAGIVAKELIVDPISQKKSIEKSYSEMLKNTPQLSGEDQAKIRSYFNVVKSFAPHAAANPLVAGSLVNKMVQFGGVDHKLVQDMASLQESSSSDGLFSKVMEGAAKSLTGVPK